MDEVLKEMTIEGFQSHRKTYFALVPGVNVIIGSNDTGKSATLRAFRSVTEMSPMYIRVGKKKVRVDLVFDTSPHMVVARERVVDSTGKLSSQCYLVYAGTEPQTWKKLGRTLPEPLEALINMGPISPDGKIKFSLNIAAQKDPPFLISSAYSGSTRIKMLGSITNQHLFDRAARAVQLDQKSSKGEIKTLGKLLNEGEDKLRALEAEPDLQVVLDQVEELERKWISARKRRQSLEQLMTRFRDLAQKLKDTNDELDQCPSTRKAQELESLCTQESTRAATYSALLRRYGEWRRSLGSLQEDLEGLPDLHRVDTVLASWEDVRGRVREDLCNRVENGLRAQAQLEGEVRQAGDVSQQAEHLLEEASQAHQRNIRLQFLLHRGRDAQTDLDGTTGDLINVQESLERARGQLVEKLEESGVCPFWSEVPFQAACREKFEC